MKKTRARERERNPREKGASFSLLQTSLESLADRSSSNMLYKSMQVDMTVTGLGSLMRLITLIRLIRLITDELFYAN